MPDRPNILLTPASWLPDGSYAAAGEIQRRRWLNAVGELAIARKRSELRRGLGSDGKPLAPVKPSSRPDGAAGKPLVPHGGSSRTWINLRSAIGLKDGTVKLYWLGRVKGVGWGTVLLWHAQGKVRGAPVRDVLDLTPAGTRRLIADSRRLWRRLTLATPKPRQGPVRTPRRRRRTAA